MALGRMLAALAIGGDQHGTMVVGPLTDRAGLTAFLTAQVDGSSTWATVMP